ncbi:cytochrome P450 [Gymnopilus junonius]|uniref:Cytochrome P450 n=1 Tax=Gymnopilus junonius TaxID=109634 RepID=A0A9P5NGH8_GYMJU|nr:cytochrome P450 [Gymnopilus junonius]
MLNVLSIAIASLVIFTLCVAYAGQRKRLEVVEKLNGPITVPYLLPWFGSFFAFNQDPLKFFKLCHQRYGKIYKVLLAGKKIVVVAHPDGIASLNRDTNKNLTNSAVFAIMMRGISNFNPSNLDYIHQVMDQRIFPITKRTLSPALMGQVTQSVEGSLRKELLALCSGEPRGPIRLKLPELISQPLYISNCAALFGFRYPSLNTFSDFELLDSGLPQILTRLPFVARRSLDARGRLLSVLVEYISPWWESDGVEDIPGASTLVMESLKEMKVSKLSKRDAAGVLLLFLWGFHSNMWYMLFWLVTHLIMDEESMRRVVDEVDACARTDAPVHDGKKALSLLESAISETLRWATTSSTVRFAEEDTEIILDGSVMVINKGEYVVGDIRAAHHDRSIFEHPEEFIVDRYLVNDHSKTVLPRPMVWGAGKHVCAGRHVAVHLMRRFMVECLSMYDIKAANSGPGGKKLPRISAKSFIGSLKPNDEVHVTITARKV